MLVNLSDIFTSGNMSTTEKTVFESDTVKVGTQEYTVADKTPVVLECSNNGVGKAIVHLNTSFTVNMNCDRCLKDIAYPFNLDFQVQVFSPDYEADEDDEEQEEQTYMEGYHLNVDDLIYNEMILDWPMKILCREDCKGICRVCGKDLNEGECGCDTFVPNPGLAGIKEIFNANKEV